MAVPALAGGMVGGGVTGTLGGVIATGLLGGGDNGGATLLLSDVPVLGSLVEATNG